MKKELTFLGVCLAAFVALMTFNSCEKVNDGKFNNSLIVNGEIVPFDGVDIDFDDATDGISIVPGIAEDYSLGSLIIQFAESLVGKRVDLSELDVYADTIALHYVHYVYFYKEEEDEHLTLSWGADFDTVLADKGSYVLVKDLGDSRFQIEMYCKSVGYEVEFFYRGLCSVNR